MDERRKTKRLIVQESFSLFLVIPDKNGMVRIYIKDISKAGVCFQMDDIASFKQGSSIDFRLYLNPAFHIPVEGTVVRVKDGEVAVEFSTKAEKITKAISKLLDFFEMAAEVAVLS